MKKILMTVAAALVGTVAFAQSKADPRALEVCKKSSQTFVQISECLPSAHVGFRTIDAFRAVYPQSAQPLASRCEELNKDSIAGAAACVTNAIQSAMRLQEALPPGSKLDDPVFNAVSDPRLQKQLNEQINAARKAFPDAGLWGGAIYQPYR